MWKLFGNEKMKMNPEIQKKKHMKRKVIRKADIVLLIVFLLAAGLLFARPFLIARGGSQSDRTVTIRQDGKVTGTYPLSRDRIITLNSSGRHNEIVIKDRTVHMEESSCKNQVCVDQGKINRVGQSIICLPNRVVVEITGNSAAEGKEDDGVDAVAQ